MAQCRRQRQSLLAARTVTAGRQPQPSLVGSGGVAGVFTAGREIFDKKLAAEVATVAAATFSRRRCAMLASAAQPPLPLPLLPLLLLLAAAATLSECRLYPRPRHETPQYWEASGRYEAEASARLYDNLRHDAKSGIIFLGDGMGLSTVTAGRILKGQLSGESGEEANLEFDTFPHVGLSRTYSMDRQTPDSACTATAFMCGVKTNNGMLGINQRVARGSCSGYNPAQHSVKSLLDHALQQGKSVGVVTTTRLTHATPASAYAKSPDRRWESDSDREADTNSPDTPEQRRACPDIATQLVERGVDFTVMLGGGRIKFLPKEMQIYDHVDKKMVAGDRSDGANLIDRWHRLQRRANRRHLYVENRTQLLSLDPSSVDSVLGLLRARTHMLYDLERQRDPGNDDPTLAEMTTAALKLLSKNPSGYFLLVEGGRIDHGHHANRAQRALHDVLAFDKAVGVAARMTSPDDTLIVVTADHGHVFTLGHYALRGQPVVDRKFAADGASYELADDKKPYTVLSYADGPRARDGARRDMSNDSIVGVPRYRYQALVPLDDESHSGEDVGIYASGPGAQLFHSVHQQSYIAHATMKAMCLGWFAEQRRCLRDQISRRQQLGSRRH